METKSRQVKKVLWLILLANMLVAGLKIVLGMLINSTSMTADGFHSVTDGTSNIIGLIGVHLAAKPVDEDHPYGHRKFETLAGLFIAGMLFFIAVKIILDGIQRFLNPAVPEITTESLIVLVLTLIINIFVSRYERGQGEKLRSDILISDAAHTRSDVFVSMGVLVSLVGIRLGLPVIIDPIASLVVSVFVLHAAYEIFRGACDILADRAAVDTTYIETIVRSFPQIKDAHKIRSRGRTDDLHIDFHVMIDPSLSVEEAHQLIHNIEDRVRAEMGKHTQVIIHIEPYYENQ